ncbi:MAG: DUF1931 family protein [Desulfohalobiaceae bacterium]
MDLTIALAKMFKLVNPDLKNPQSRNWEQVISIFNVLLEAPCMGKGFARIRNNLAFARRMLLPEFFVPVLPLIPAPRWDRILQTHCPGRWSPSARGLGKVSGDAEFIPCGREQHGL